MNHNRFSVLFKIQCPILSRCSLTSNLNFRGFLVHCENMLNQLHQFIKNRVFVLVLGEDGAADNPFHKGVESDFGVLDVLTPKPIIVN